MSWWSFSPVELAGSAALLSYAGILGWKVRAALAYCGAEKRQLEAPVEPYAITLLQPILSGDPTLRTCLSRTLDLRSQGAEIIWLVDEGDAEAIQICDDLKGPGVTVTACPPSPVGVNPKVDKLERALAHVSTEFLAVLDDDTTLGGLHLDRAIGTLRQEPGPGGIYSGLPTYSCAADGGARGAGSLLTAAFVNGSSALTYLPAAHSAPPVTLNGMFYVTRAEDLRQVGGFGAIRSALCDDLAMAKLFQKAGRPIHQGSTAQLLMTSGMGLAEYFRRMHRWFVFASVLVRGLGSGPRLRLALTLGAPPLLLWVALVCALASKGLTLLVGAVLVARFLALGALLEVTRDGSSKGGSVATVFPVSSLLSELLQPVHAVHAALVPTIRWRTRLMRVRRDGSFESLGDVR